MTPDDDFAALLTEIRACTRCAVHLPLGPNPIVRGARSARLLIVSQAPGTRVHETGLSFNDKSGDRPPRPECAPLWHPRLRPHFGAVALTLLVGSYAIRHYLPGARGATMAATLVRWRDFLPEFCVLPHPSWRTTAWQRANPRFAAQLLPELRARVAAALSPLPRSAPCPRR